jgi:hypothetical protein
VEPNANADGGIAYVMRTPVQLEPNIRKEVVETASSLAKQEGNAEDTLPLMLFIT